MASGGGGGTTSQSTSYTANIPKWAKPYHKDLLSSADQYMRDNLEYEQYGEPRIADFDEDEQIAMQAYRDLYAGGDAYADRARQAAELGYQLPGMVEDVGTDYSGIDPSRLSGILGGDPHILGSQVYPPQASGPGLTMADDPGRTDYSDQFGLFTDEGVAESYMNPYVQNVLAQQIAEARGQFDEEDMATEAQRVAAGSRGGYRATLADYMGGNTRAETIADITGRGLSAAYTGAEQQFERDRASQMAAARMTEDSLTAAQNRFSQNRDAYLRAVQMGDQSAMQAARMEMDASKYNQDMILRQADAARQSANLESQLGDTDLARRMKVIQQQERVGAMEREKHQRQLDMDYEDWLQSQRHTQNQINWMSGLLSGVPGVLPERQMRPAPSFISQLAGLGLGGAAIGKMMQS